MRKKIMALGLAGALVLGTGPIVWSEGADQQTQQAIHTEVGEAGGAEGAGEGTETGAGGGEENTTQYGLGDTFDQVRAGSRLIMNYDPAANAFVGTVENTTNTTLKNVRIEIHLSNGVELGPTAPIDLAPGEIANVRLDATTQPFDTWVAHAEVGTQGTDQGTGNGEGAGEGTEGTGAAEGAGEGTETGAGGGEENTTQYGLGDTFDQVRAGSRLIMNYDPAANAFIGTVENTTNTTLKNVRIEIHLSNGVELGPTAPIDLAPGEIANVRLDATTQPFDTWVAHAEVGTQGTDQGTGSGTGGAEGAGEGSEGSGEAHGPEGGQGM